MYNNELYRKLEQRFGQNTIKLFAIIEAYKYSLLSEECSNKCDDVFYEKEWWNNIVEQNKTTIIKS